MTARLHQPRPDELTPEQRDLYDRLVTGKRATGPRALPLTDAEGRLQGPFNAMLLNPELGDPLQRVGVAVRYGTALTARQREIATLAVAAAESSAYEWAAHAHLARAAGVTDEQITAIRDGGEVPLDDAAERTVLDTARELLTTGDLGDGGFAAARDALGITVLYELITLVGYYRLLALQLRTLRVTAPDDGTESS